MNVYAVNEETGEMLQDVIMCHILGVEKLPDGYHVEFVDGDTLNCQRENLYLAPDSAVEQ